MSSGFNATVRRWESKVQLEALRLGLVGVNKFRWRILRVLAAIVAAFLLVPRSSSSSTARVEGSAPTPSAQAKDGPGGSNYHHAKVVAKSYGKGATAYWLYEPAAPTPKSAPLVILNHGWLAYIPGAYAAWTDHLVRRGNIVVYPVYQDSPFTRGDRFTPNALQAVKDAIVELKTGQHVRPELDKFALVGHSAGGIITADLAVLAQAQGLPEPRAIMIIEPGRGDFFGKPNLPIQDYTKMPSAALILVVIGQSYSTNELIWPAKPIFRQASVSATNKNFVTILSDSRGKPKHVSDHLAASGKWGGSGGMAVDAMDYYAHWKLFDALCDAAFYNRNRACALGNTPEQRFMGRWSDGTAVRELVVTDSVK